MSPLPQSMSVNCRAAGATECDDEPGGWDHKYRNYESLHPKHVALDAKNCIERYGCAQEKVRCPNNDTIREILQRLHVPATTSETPPPSQKHSDTMSQDNTTTTRIHFAAQAQIHTCSITICETMYTGSNPADP